MNAMRSKLSPWVVLALASLCWFLGGSGMARAQECQLQAAFTSSVILRPGQPRPDVRIQVVARGECSWQVSPTFDDNGTGIRASFAGVPSPLRPNSTAVFAATLTAPQDLAEGTYHARFRLDIVRILGDLRKQDPPQFGDLTLTVLPPTPSTQPSCSVTPAALDFGEQAVGATSAQRIVTLKSTGTAPLTVGAAKLTGVHAGDFAFTPDISGATLAPGQSQQISVSFTPSLEGTRSGSLTLTSNALNSCTVSLSGTGVTQAAQRRVTVGDPVESIEEKIRLSLFERNPLAGEVTRVVGVGDDGAVYVLDHAGTALVRLPPPLGSAGQILLDTTRPNPPDGIGLARLLQAKTSRNGVSGIVALGADNRRRIYRLDRGALSLLAQFPDARGQVELAISDDGQIAYIAPLDSSPGSPFALFLVLPGQAPRLLVTVGNVTSGLTVTGIRSLQINGAGVLTYILDLRDPNGAPVQAVLRGTSTGQMGVAVTGRNTPGLTGPLTEVRQPRIGPDGTIVFLGSGAPPRGGGPGFVNFFAARPRQAPQPQALQPLLRFDNWSTVEGSFDYDIAADGSVAVRARRRDSTDSMLLLVGPTGVVTEVAARRQDMQPVEQPVFGPDGRLFFLAENQELALDRNGRFQLGLYRFLPGAMGPVGMAMPGQAVPGWRDARLLGFMQPPLVSSQELIFAAVFGGPESLPVPTAAVFRVPLDGALAAARLVAAEGHPIADTPRLAMIRELAYRPDGTLLFSGLLPGAGPLIAPARAPASTASRVRAQATPAATAIKPLVVTGDRLVDGQLESALPPLLSLGSDRALFAARTSHTLGPDRLPNREGLFTVRPDRQVERVAGSRLDVPNLPGFLFNGFADTRLFTLNPPSSTADGRLVFKALLDPGASGPRPPAFGVFQWKSGGALDWLRLSHMDAAFGDRPPFSLGQLGPWAAGSSGLTYLLERPNGAQARLLAGSGRPLQPLVVPGVKTDRGSVLTDLTDFVLSRRGTLFLLGSMGNAFGILRRDDQGQLQVIALIGDRVPPLPDGGGQGFTFAGEFTLLPASASRQELLFRARVQSGARTQRGEFALGPAGLQTLGIEGVLVDRARSLTASLLADTPPALTESGFQVQAYYDDRSGWVIERFRLTAAGIAGPELIAKKEQRLPGGKQIVALDAGPMLERQTPRSGPVFTVNEAGDVAFLASDGSGWGVYVVPAK